jgi:hypothetical protein
LKIASSPGSATSLSASAMAEKPPVVIRMSSGAKGMSSQRRSDAAAASCASGSLHL